MASPVACGWEVAVFGQEQWGLIIEKKLMTDKWTDKARWSCVALN